MRLSVADFIDEVVQEIDHGSIVVPGPDRTELDCRMVLKGAASRSDGVKVYIAHHGATVVNQSVVFACLAVISTDLSRSR